MSNESSPRNSLALAGQPAVRRGMRNPCFLSVALLCQLLAAGCVDGDVNLTDICDTCPWVMGTTEEPVDSDDSDDSDEGSSDTGHSEADSSSADGSSGGGTTDTTDTGSTTSEARCDIVADTCVCDGAIVSSAQCGPCDLVEDACMCGGEEGPMAWCFPVCTQVQPYGACDPECSIPCIGGLECVSNGIGAMCTMACEGATGCPPTGFGEPWDQPSCSEGLCGIPCEQATCNPECPGQVCPNTGAHACNVDSDQCWPG